MGTLYEDLCTFTVISCSFLFRMRNISEKHLTIGRKRIACWITKATDTLRIFNNIDFTLEQCYANRLNITSYITSLSSFV